MSDTKKKRKGFFKKKKDPFVATPMEFIYRTDFDLHDDPINNWVIIELKRGDYAGVKYKYNSIGVVSEPKSVNDNLHMKMDYDILETAGRDKATLEADPQFNNVLFNMIHTLLTIQNYKDEDATRGNDLGELDRE